MESPVKSAQCRWSTNGRASNTSLLASRREQGLYKQQAPSSVMVSEDLEENTNYVTASILQAAKLSSPAPKIYLERPLAPFWNENCRLAIKERNRKRNIFRRNRTQESFENYKRAKGRAQWVVKNAKKECWQSFCSRLNRNTDLGTLWRTIKSMNPDFLWTISAKPRETLADTFALASSNANLSSSFAQIKNSFTLTPEIFQPDLYDSPLSEPISITEIHGALRKCGNSSPGPDGIHYDMLRKLPYSSLEGVLSHLNQSWLSGRLPSSWKKATVIPIPKKRLTLFCALLQTYIPDLHPLQIP